MWWVKWWVGLKIKGAGNKKALSYNNLGLIFGGESGIRTLGGR